MLKHLITSAIVCILTHASFAQSSLRDSLGQDIVITHSKVSRSIKETAKPTIIISKEEIEASGAIELSQVLNAQAGVIVNGAYSNPSLNKTTYVQGGSGENLLYLINGMPVSDPTSIGGPFDIRSIDLESIERIEILKGSQSTLYGSNAISGIINIITTQATDQPLTISGQTQYATYGNFLQGLTASGTTGALSYRISGQYNTSKGISEATQPESATAEYDNDGYDKTNVSAQISYAITPAVTIAPFYRYGSFDGDYDGGAFSDAANTYDTKYQNMGGRLSYSSNVWKSYLDYSHMNTERTFESQFGVNNFDGTLDHIDWYNELTFNNRNNLLLGVNYQQISMADSSTMPIDPSNNILSFYAQYQWKPVDEWTLEAGLRTNNHSQYGSNINYEVNTAYWITPQLKAMASIGTGFKAPLLSQLYGQWGANADLMPQESQYWQGGLEYSWAKSSKLSATYFNREVTDIIIYSTNPQTSAPQYRNIPKQSTQGIEIDAQVELVHGLSLSAQYIYLTGETIQAGNVTSEVLLRRPKSQIAGQLTYSPASTWSAYLSLDNVGAREDVYFDLTDFQSKQVTLDSYTLMNIGGSFKPLDQLTVRASIFNLFDSDFTELHGYNTLGRHLRMSLHYSF